MPVYYMVMFKQNVHNCSSEYSKIQCFFFLLHCCRYWISLQHWYTCIIYSVLTIYMYHQLSHNVWSYYRGMSTDCRISILACHDIWLYEDVWTLLIDSLPSQAVVSLAHSFLCILSLSILISMRCWMYAWSIHIAVFPFGLLYSQLNKRIMIRPKTSIDIVHIEKPMKAGFTLQRGSWVVYYLKLGLGIGWDSEINYH